MPLAHDGTGKFKRQHQLWIFEHWDDGMINNRGRFLVFRPDCPRAFASGYALRSHVVFWLTTGTTPPLGTVLHHDDENKLNDRFENLVVKEHGQHTRDHCQLPRLELVCDGCGKEFQRNRQHGVRYNKNYCSHACFNRSAKSPETRLNISQGLVSAYAEGRR